MPELGLDHLNALGAEDAEAELLKCCGSKSWARRISRERPFRTIEDLIKKSEDVWWSLETSDWLEAFRSHPKIGEREAVQLDEPETRKWSEQEQSGVDGASEQTRNSLAELNRKYEKKFGFIFIVCATGKTSEDMLSILQQRLGRSREEELRVAASEHAKITELRIIKLLKS